MNSMPDVACIGSCLIDTFLDIHNASLYCTVHEQDRLLCVKFGEKIPLENVRFGLGGNACNVAVSLVRLGLQSSLVAEVGTDEFSDKILRELDKERVDTALLLRVPGRTSVAFAIQFQGERTLFTEHITRKHQFAFDDISAKWVYLTSLGNEWHHVYARIAEIVVKKGIRVAFNPGTLQLEEGVSSLNDILSHTEILFLNREEAVHLVADHNASFSHEQLLDKALQAGPKLVVITDGKNGSFAKEQGGQLLSCPIVDAPIVEKTGAGDAFASGFLAAMVRGKSIEEAMQWGTHNAASVVGKVGAQEGLLTLEEMGQKVNI